MRLKTEQLLACPVCKGQRLHAITDVPDFESSTGTYGIVECLDCGIAFTNPRPVESELPTLYAERSSADFAAGRPSPVEKLRELAIDRYLARQLDQVQIGAGSALQVLDFGCGDGALCRGVVRYAIGRGAPAKVTAVDFHPEMPPSLGAMEPSRVRYASYKEWHDESESYDAIFLRHVLEHHPDPLRLLGQLRGVLRPGGRLFVEVPNRRSVWASVFGRYFFAYYVPRHLVHFDSASLRSVVERSGFRCLGLSLGHTPLLGRSIAYRMGLNIGNLGFVGLASYPIQVLVDMLAHASTTLQATAVADA